MIYFSFGIAPSMFPSTCTIRRESVSPEYVRGLPPGSLVPALNPSHQATITAMRERFAIDVPIPETAPQVLLGVMDSVIVMGVRGLPRLQDRHEYTRGEIEGATFEFSLFVVTE